MPKNPTHTKQALVEAALATLREEGYAGTTARAIASRADVNQALVFYHFCCVDGLLRAALDVSSAERLAQYRAAMDAASSTAEKVTAARLLYRDDVTSGHATVISELVAASMARPELRTELLDRMQPWLALVVEVFREVAGSSPFADAIPVE